MSRKAVFRCDASPIIGVGHVVRSGVLADALIRNGWECEFVGRAETADFVNGLSYFKHPVSVSDALFEEEPDWLTARGGSIDLLVVDHYSWTAEMEARCRGWARRVFVVDDRASDSHDCDYLLDQSIGRQAGDYHGLVPAGCELIVGADYALVRDSFRDGRPAALERRREARTVQRILVSLGGGDQSGALTQVLKALAAAEFDGEVHVVAGKNREVIVASAYGTTSPFDLRVHHNVEDMADLMIAAELGIGASGTSTYERLCLVLPSVVLVLADNQWALAGGLARLQLARVVDYQSDTVLADLTREIVALLPFDARAILSERAAAVCDGAGAERIVSRLWGHG